MKNRRNEWNDRQTLPFNLGGQRGEYTGHEWVGLGGLNGICHPRSSVELGMSTGAPGQGGRERRRKEEGREE